MKDRDVAIAALLLWLLWPRPDPSGSAAAAFVGWTPEGQPVPLTPPPAPVVIPPPATFPYYGGESGARIDSWGWPVIYDAWGYPVHDPWQTLLEL